MARLALLSEQIVIFKHIDDHVLFRLVVLNQHEKQLTTYRQTLQQYISLFSDSLDPIAIGHLDIDALIYWLQSRHACPRAHRLADTAGQASRQASRP